MNYRCVPVVAIALCLVANSPLNAQKRRISQAIRGGKRAPLVNHVPAQARTENDQGPAPRDLRLQSMTLVLQPSAEQESDLEQLLARQQDPASPDYHRWLSPDEYANRFGVNAEDLKKIADWLAS